MSLSTAMITASNTINMINDSLNSTAHNIANVNTPGFKSVDYYAPFVENDGLSYYGGFLYENAELFPTIGAMSELEPYHDEIIGIAQNDVNVVTEYLRLIQSENSLAANTKVMSSVEAMNGYLMDLTL